MNRTPVLVVAGQVLTDDVCDRLARDPGTLVVTHRFDGQVVVRSVTIRRVGELHTTEWPLELINCCVDCTIHDDLLILLRRLHRRDDVGRIVVSLAPWLEPEPACWAINNVDVHVGPGYADGPAARDVAIDAVLTTVDVSQWLPDALSTDELEDERTVAQVVVGQAEFADVLVLSAKDRRTQAVLRRLAPRASLVVGTGLLHRALAAVSSDARRGCDHDPHAPLLSGEPTLTADGDVKIVEFEANRPFHPMRLHLAIDDLLEGVVRIMGRAWIASQPDSVVWIESAGGGLRVADAGRWLAGSSPEERAEADPDRVALANLRWDSAFGDRHISLTALVCGADPDVITRALSGALLNDRELSEPDTWMDYGDPFGEWHEDPCEDLDKVEYVRWHRRPDGDGLADR